MRINSQGCKGLKNIIFTFSSSTKIALWPDYVMAKWTLITAKVYADKLART